MIKRPFAVGLIFLFTFLASLTARPAAADLVGLRGGVYTHLGDPFLGAEFILRVDHRIFFNPNVEYVFVTNTTYMTFNGDLHYDFHTHSNTYLWAGGGLAVIYDKPNGLPSSTDLGANIFVGAGLRGAVIPYIQAKFIAKSDPEFAIAFGIRF